MKKVMKDMDDIEEHSRRFLERVKVVWGKVSNHGNGCVYVATHAVQGRV